MTEEKAPIELAYETSGDTEPVGPRPWWVWVIVVVYLLVMAALIGWPALVAFSDPDETGLLLLATGIGVVLALAGLGLLVVPVKQARRRPVSRRTVWIPIVTSGFLLGILAMGAAWALIEFFRDDKGSDALFIASWIGGGAVWVAWSLLWWFLAGYGGDPAATVSKLHRWVLGGSVAELLVAVPTHLVVRKRSYCCAGIYTGTAICLGVVVMVIAFGPGVAFLFYKRWKRIRTPVPSPGTPGEG
ncbi:MAG TPA: hypothetical protein VH518_10420 [Tepidisphaeraceae bacterium]|jgi:hypothetical protein